MLLGLLSLLIAIPALPANGADPSEPEGVTADRAALSPRFDPRTDVDYQLSGPHKEPRHVGILVRDVNAKPAPGRYNVCYVNGFQTQPQMQKFWRKRMALVLTRNGEPVVDEAWGEWLLDLRTDSNRKRLAKIVGRWTDDCARKGFDAVEFDNLDSYTRSYGMLKRSQAKAYAKLLIRDAHRVGLRVGQKNLADLNGSKIGYDFAIAESCARYRECGNYTRYYGRQVLMIEYQRSSFDRGCRRFGHRVPIVLRDRALTPKGRHAYC